MIRYDTIYFIEKTSVIYMTHSKNIESVFEPVSQGCGIIKFYYLSTDK